MPQIYKKNFYQFGLEKSDRLLVYIFRLAFTKQQDEETEQLINKYIAVINSFQHMKATKLVNYQTGVCKVLL